MVCPRTILISHWSASGPDWSPIGLPQDQTELPLVYLRTRLSSHWSAPGPDWSPIGLPQDQTDFPLVCLRTRLISHWSALSGGISTTPAQATSTLQPDQTFYLKQLRMLYKYVYICLQDPFIESNLEFCTDISVSVCIAPWSVVHLAQGMILPGRWYCLQWVQTRKRKAEELDEHQVQADRQAGRQAEARNQKPEARRKTITMDWLFKRCRGDKRFVCLRRVVVKYVFWEGGT